MEKPSRSTPAQLSPRSTVLITLIIATLSFLPSSAATTNATTVQEVDAAISSLRSIGYTLFANAISTSDLRFFLINTTSFTLFSPRDSSLFSLDMSSSASDYVRALRYHVAPRRLSFSDLRNLSHGSHLETLFPHHGLLLAKSQVLANRFVSDLVTVNGIRILVPDLYLGSRIAVHGLDGILDAGFRSDRNFSDDPRFVSPSVSPAECVSPRSPRFEPDLVTPVEPPVDNESANITKSSSSKKNGKHHKDHSRRNSQRRVHGHHEPYDVDHNDDGI